MRKKFFQNVLPAVSLILILILSSSASAAEYQVSGTGYNYPVPLFRASVSVNVNSLSPGTSYFKYYYTRNRLSFVSTAITGIAVSGSTATITGAGTVNGTDGYTFTAAVTDTGASAATKDSTAIEIRKPDGGIYFKDPSSGARSLESGDFVISVTKVWSGGGSDSLASNPANWSDGTTPQNGDKILFNGTSVKNCTWDTAITSDSFTMDSGYAGTVALISALTVTENLDVTGGILNLNGNALSAGKNITIGANGSLYALSSIIFTAGNWSNSGIFNSGASTVIFTGANQTIYGSNAFYNLNKNTASADTLYFEAGKTQTITNSLTLNGANSSMLSLRGTSQGSYWLINPQGTRNISFVDVKNSQNIHPVIINAVNSVSSGNNVNWDFSDGGCAF